MKTIEQAAKEYVDNNGWWKRDDQPLTYQEHQETFKKGVEFAQRWISVEDELPESGKTVLIQDKNSYVGLACRRYGDWDYKYKKMITHWRPITFK
jgi:hypothetical protein